MRRQAYLLLLLATAVAAGCKQRGAAGRHYIASTFDTLWVASEHSGAGLLDPGALTFAHGRILVVDQAERQVVALDPASGSVLWRFGGQGAGPREFRLPSSPRALPTGQVAVLDYPNQRVTVLGADGTLVRTISLVSTAGPPESFCALGEGHLLLEARFVDSLLVFDTNTGGLNGVRKPWPEPHDPDGALRQGLIVSDEHGRDCAVVMYRGLHFAMLPDGRFGEVRPYIESWELFAGPGVPDPAEDHIAAWDAAIVGDTLWVLFGGRTEVERRVLDAYSTQSGAYLGSLLLPQRAGWFTAHGGHFFVGLRQEDDTYAIVALAPRQGD